jgi:hypothetical protein
MALDQRFGGDPWWLPLHPSNNPLSFRFQLSPTGMFITRNMLWLLELVRCDDDMIDGITICLPA